MSLSSWLKSHLPHLLNGDVAQDSVHAKPSRGSDYQVQLPEHIYTYRYLATDFKLDYGSLPSAGIRKGPIIIL